jgi:hypothetical protein
MNGRFIDLMRWNGAVNHVASLAIYEETNIRACRRFRLRLCGKYHCFHLFS